LAYAAGVNVRWPILALAVLAATPVRGLDPDHDPLVLVARGQRAHQAGQTNDAEKLYRRALELQPYQAEAHQHLGLLLLAGPQKEDGVRHVATALALRPKSTEVRVAIAESLCNLGYLQDAEVLLREALRLDANNVPTLRQLARVEFALGRKEDALRTYQTWVRADSHNPELRYDYAQLLLQLNHTAKAEAELREALRLKRRYPAAYYALGLLVSQQDRTREAIECYQQAVFWDNTFAEAYNNLGAIYLAQNREREAATMFDKARASFRQRGDSNQVARLDRLLKELDPLDLLVPGAMADAPLPLPPPLDRSNAFPMLPKLRERAE